MNRPLFSAAWHAFAEVHLSVMAVGKKIGGYVQKNIDGGFFENACPIRMSYVLNKTGFPIHRSASYAMVTGGDNLQYIYRVNDMMRYLGNTFGQPDKVFNSPVPSNFLGMQGIVIIQGQGWSNARGHITLWNGAQCADTCHMMGDPENGSFMPDTASIWLLP